MRCKIGFFFSVLFFTLFFIGCSDEYPILRLTNPSVVFEYSDEESLGKARLSFFIEEINNIKKCQFLKIINKESDYYWTSDEIIFCETKERHCAGYTNLVVPEGEKIPEGKYTVNYYQGDGKESNVETIINYDQSIYEYKASEIPDYMRQKGAVQKIAVYSKNNELIYFGEKGDNLRDTRGVWNTYPESLYYNDVWCFYDNSVMCIMPAVEVEVAKK